jgi:hypothetical protein
MKLNITITYKNDSDGRCPVVELSKVLADLAHSLRSTPELENPGDTITECDAGGNVVAHAEISEG